MKRNASKISLQADIKLALSIILLWSVGRVINPIRHFEEEAGRSFGPVLNVSIILYVILHIGVFLYAFVLFVRSLRRNGFSMRGRALWEFCLYVYVLLAILVSLYFIAYEFGYLPAFLQSLVPYSDLNS